MPRELTPKQDRFIAEDLKDLNAKQAAVRAGYSKRSASQIADRLLKTALVKTQIDALKQQQLDSAQVTATRILEELGRIAFQRPKAYWYTEQDEINYDAKLAAQDQALNAGTEIGAENARNGAQHGAQNGTNARLKPRTWRAGDFKPIHELSDDEAAAIAGFEVLIKNAKAGDGITDQIHKLKFWDKNKALEILAKHFGMLVEKREDKVLYRIEWMRPDESETVEAEPAKALPGEVLKN
jgi:phage terminase small subunit